MKSKLFVLVMLFIFLFPIITSAQSIYYVYTHNISQIGDHEEFSATISENIMVNGYIEITSDFETSISFLIFNEDEFIKFDDTVSPVNGTYNATADFEILDIGRGDKIFWKHPLFVSNESVWYFVWLKVDEESDVTTIKVMVESGSTLTTTTNTTTTTTTTTSGITTTTTDRIENTLLIYLLLGVLGGIGVIVVYMVIRPRKVKYVWDVK